MNIKLKIGHVAYASTDNKNHYGIQVGSFQTFSFVSLR